MVRLVCWVRHELAKGVEAGRERGGVGRRAQEDPCLSMRMGRWEEDLGAGDRVTKTQCATRVWGPWEACLHLAGNDGYWGICRHEQMMGHRVPEVSRAQEQSLDQWKLPGPEKSGVDCTGPSTTGPWTRSHEVVHSEGSAGEAVELCPGVLGVHPCVLHTFYRD